MTMIQAITQQRLEQTLARYINMPTVATDIEACTSALQEIGAQYQKLGMNVHHDGPTHPWLIATTTPEAMIAKRVKILFVIHFDIVPLENDAQRVLRVTHDKLYGRGVYDMKFAAAAVTEMLVDLAKEGDVSDYDFGVLITTDEEKGGYDGAVDFLNHGWACDLAIIPDGGYNWTVEKRAKSVTYLYLTAYGRSAHSSRPWLGDNPISKLAPAIAEITQHFTHDDHKGVVVSINSLESSNSSIAQTTQIAKWARAGVSVRAFTDEETQSAINLIDDIAKKHSVTADITLNESSVALDEANPLVQRFIAVASEIHCEPVGFSDAYAASDARHFSKFNIPTVLMYPEGGDHHGPNEWITRSDLYKYYRLCKTYIEQNAVAQKEHANSTAAISGR